MSQEYRPTTNLRFVERSEPSGWGTREVSAGMVSTVRIIRVLQQWWEHPVPLYDSGTKISVGEWRDVPLGVE